MFCQDVKMRGFRFIHAADLHLDSPFRGLSETSQALGDELQSATFRAFERVVAHAIASEADFVVLAGDLYDSKDRSLRALVEFRRQMERLAERGIPVYVVHGNHDPLDGWGSRFRMPDNVRVFDGNARAEPVIRDGREIARVTGVSYTQERVTENLARSLPPSGEGVYSIALLHANVGGQSGHAEYAPATVSELVEAGFDYWALGHVHTRAVLRKSPAIVYPGNPQGRHARERGPRGCYEVTVTDAGRTRLKFVETDVVRWEQLDYGIGGHASMEDLIEGLEAGARRLVSGFGGPVVLRCRLTGDGPLHADLQRDGVSGDLARQLGRLVHVESLAVATAPEADLERRVRTEPIVGDFLALVERAREDPEYRKYLEESLAPLFRRRDLPTPDPARIQQWIEQAGKLGLDLLLES
jgi:DNA repair exonuclease SbcCD nuclease subunit